MAAKIKVVNSDDLVVSDLSHYVDKKYLIEFLDDKWPPKKEEGVTRVFYTTETDNQGDWRVWAPRKLTTVEKTALQDMSQKDHRAKMKQGAGGGSNNDD